MRIALFETLMILALWSHIKTLTSDPGFIPRGYNYNIKLMTPANVSLYNYITLSREKQNAIDKAKVSLAKSHPIATTQSSHSSNLSKTTRESSDKVFTVIIPNDKRLSLKQQRVL